MKATPMRDMPPGAAAWSEFCEARRAMVAAWRDWLAHAPTPAEVGREIEQTRGLLRGGSGVGLPWEETQ